MKEQKARETWRGLSEEVIVGMSEWRAKHPKAGPREIEE